MRSVLAIGLSFTDGVQTERNGGRNDGVLDQEISFALG